MRIFVYLLALLTGLSAAQNAEARHDAAAALDVASSLSDAAEIAISAEYSLAATDWLIELPTLKAVALPSRAGKNAVKMPACVYRGDRSRE